MSVRQVPNELWLDIFRGLPRDTIKALFVTSFIFKDICRSFLFAHFNFYPYALAEDAILLPPDIVIERALERLEFWTSDDIASNVRSCEIVPWQIPLWQKIGAVWSKCEFSTRNSPYILLDSFFERMVKFTGLRSLRAEKIRFTHSRIAALCRAPVLVEVRLCECSVAGGERIDTTSLQLDVPRFMFTHKTASVEEGIGFWVSLLRPDCLREVGLRCNLRATDVAAIPVLPLFRGLATTLIHSTMSYELSIAAGPSPDVEIFSTDRSWSSWERFSSNVRLTVIPGPSNILSLYVTFDIRTDTSMLDRVCSFFPNLTELRVRIHSWVRVWEINVIQLMVARSFIELGKSSVLPPGLERIAFIWCIQCDYAGSRLQERLAARQPALIPDFKNLRDALVTNYPALNTIWFDGHNLLYHWRKSLHGIVVEGDAKNEHAAVKMRRDLGGFNTFWERQ